MKVIKVKKADKMERKKIGYVELYKGGFGEPENGPWRVASITHPNSYLGLNIVKLKSYLKEIEQQAKDLKTAIAFMEKENA